MTDISGVVGLQNIGNTCYMNSSIQILRAIPELNNLCLSQNLDAICENKKDSNNVKILLGFQDLIKTLWSTSKPAFVRPLGFVTVIRNAVKGSVYEMFGLPIPNDSHEFLIYLLDNFHEALSMKLNIEVGDRDSTSDMDMNELAKNGWARFLKCGGHSPIIDLFFGMMRKTIVCQHCLSKSYQWETFNILKIPCQGTTFADWIENEHSVSDLSDYDCIKCRPERRCAKIHSHIWCLPQMMFIAIKRFKPDFQKDMSHCPYAGEIINFERFFAQESPEQSKTWKYTLCGTVDHHGSHRGGHYVSQFKHPTTSEWWLFDDEASHKLNNGPMFNNSNYLFLFRKV